MAIVKQIKTKSELCFVEITIGLLLFQFGTQLTLTSNDLMYFLGIIVVFIGIYLVGDGFLRLGKLANEITSKKTTEFSHTSKKTETLLNKRSKVISGRKYGKKTHTKRKR